MQTSNKERLLLELVQAERLLQPRLGTRKLQHLLERHHHMRIGRDTLFNLLRARHLLVPTRRAYHKTTQSHHRFYCHPNLVKTGPDKVTPTGPEQLWVADITYVPTARGDVYLSLITDAWSRKIVGYHVDDNLRAESVMQAYRQALRQRRGRQQLVHHSDRGIQYCSAAYQALHKKHEVRCSMTDGYDCYQNALAERINGILKNEYLLVKPVNIEQATTMVDEAVSIYNTRRPHLALQYKTPDEVHRAFN